MVGVIGRPRWFLTACVSAAAMALSAGPAVGVGTGAAPPGADHAEDPTDTSAAWAQADAIRERVQPPEFPHLEVSIVDLGADPTGREKSTEAIDAAISLVSESG